MFVLWQFTTHHIDVKAVSDEKAGIIDVTETESASKRVVEFDIQVIALAHFDHFDQIWYVKSTKNIRSKRIVSGFKWSNRLVEIQFLWYTLQDVGSVGSGEIGYEIGLSEIVFRSLSEIHLGSLWLNVSTFAEYN